MSNSPCHRVKQAIFDVQFLDEQTAFSARERLADLFYTSILPVLEEAFDTYADSDRIYHIDRLEIDLGHLHPDQFNEASIRQTILNQLKDHWMGTIFPTVAPQSQGTSLQEILTQFLATGTLPWHSNFKTVEAMENALRSLPPPESDRIMQAMLPLLQQPSIRLRLIYQFSTACFEWIIRQLHPTTAEHLLQVGRRTFNGLDSPDAKASLLTVAIALPPNHFFPPEILENQLRANAQFPGQPAVTQQHPEVRREGLKPTPLDLPQQLPTPVASDIKEWYVQNAGIVLLHPFLPQLFDHLTLLTPQQHFVSIEAQMTAIHLLHYLATGHEQPQEHETLLYKILCGFPVEQPLVRELSLNQQDKVESGDLLRAVIHHWEKLKRTSPDGLRQAFLQRDGKLTQRKTGWKLIVEQRSLDVLLNYLPWGVSIVRSPWMESLLSVDWA